MPKNRIRHVGDPQCALDSQPNPICHYVIVRSDLPLGILAAHIIHAAGQSSPGNLSDGTFAVALESRDEDSLLALYTRLVKAQIACILVRESDPPYTGQAMAIGVFPKEKRSLKKALSSCRLLG